MPTNYEKRSAYQSAVKATVQIMKGAKIKEVTMLDCRPGEFEGIELASKGLQGWEYSLIFGRIYVGLIKNRSLNFAQIKDAVRKAQAAAALIKEWAP